MDSFVNLRNELKDQKQINYVNKLIIRFNGNDDNELKTSQAYCRVHSFYGEKTFLSDLSKIVYFFSLNPGTKIDMNNSYSMYCKSGISLCDNIDVKHLIYMHLNYLKLTPEHFCKLSIISTKTSNLNIYLFVLLLIYCNMSLLNHALMVVNILTPELNKLNGASNRQDLVHEIMDTIYINFNSLPSFIPDLNIYSFIALLCACNQFFDDQIKQLILSYGNFESLLTHLEEQNQKNKFSRFISICKGLIVEPQQTTKSKPKMLRK